MATANTINTPSKRQKLPIRREPFWQPIARGRALGFRKSPSGGAWILKVNRKQSRIGDVTDFTYTEAMERAGDLVKTVSNKVDAKLSLTLLQVFEQYRSIKAIEKDEKSATTNHKRLLNILPDNLLNAPAVSITSEQFVEWRNSRVYVPADHEETAESEILDKIKASKSSVNRDIAPIKAALRGVFGDTSQYGWSSLTKFANVDKGRVLFLTSDEVERWTLHSEVHLETYQVRQCSPVCGWVNYGR